MTENDGDRVGIEPGPAGAALGEPSLRHLPPASLLCLTTHGPYWKLSPTFARLRSWMRAADVTAAGPAMGVFYDDPGVTPPEACRYSICYPLGTEAAVGAEDALAAGRHPLPPRVDAASATSNSADAPTDTLTIQRTAETAVATLVYAGPAAHSAMVYERIDRWIEERGLTPSGPPREVYLAEPGTLGKGSMHAEVQQPVMVP